MADALDQFLAARDAGNPAPAPAGSPFSRGLRAGGLGMAADLHGLAGQAGEGVSRFFGQYGHTGVRDAAASFAASQRAAAVANEQEAAQATEGLPQRFADIHSAGDALDYGAQLAGKSLPAIGAGLVGGGAAALAAPELAGASLLGMTAATAPLTIGGQYNAQQADPVQAAQPFGLRTGMGAGVGTLQAGLMSAVPAAMGGKVFGKVAAETVGQPLGRALASNLGEAVVGNSAAAVGSTYAGQRAASALNPGRDTSGDGAEMLNSGVDAAVLGAPFGVVGAAGDMRGPRRSVVSRIRAAAGSVANGATALAGRARDAAGSVADSVTGADPQSLTGRVRDGVTDAVRSGTDTVRDIFTGKADPMTQAARDIAAGDTDGVKTLDPEAFATASPEAQQAMRAVAQKTRHDQIYQMAADLNQDQTLAPEAKAALDAMQGDYTSAANALKVAGMVLHQKQAKAGVSAIDSLFDWVNEQRAKVFGGDDKATQAENGGAPRLNSEFSPEITAVIKDIVTPALRQHNPAVLENPDALNKLAESLRGWMSFMTDEGEDATTQLPEHVADHLKNVFGGDTVRVLDALTEALAPGDVGLLREVNRLGKVESLGGRRERALGQLLGPDLVKRHGLNRDELRTIGNAIAAHVDGSAYRHLGGEAREYQSRAFEDMLAEQFGDDSAQRVLDAFAKDQQQRQGVAGSTRDDRAHSEDDAGLTVRDGIDSDESSADILGAGHEMSNSERNETGLEHTTGHGEQLADQYDETAYYGEGPNHKMVRTPEAWRARAVQKGYDLDKPAPVDALQRQLENGPGRDRTITFVPFKELPKELRDAHFARIRHSMEKKGLSEAEALAQHGNPNEIGMFRVEGLKQEGRMTDAELDHLSVDTGKTSHRDSPSRIVTGELGHSIDAIRLVRMFGSRGPANPTTGEKGPYRVPRNRADEKGALYRLAHVFMEGIASVQDHLGRGFEIPDSTVLKLGYDDQGNRDTLHDVTWGQLRGKVLTDAQRALMEQHPAGTAKGDKLRQIFGGRGDKGLSMMPHNEGHEPTEFTQFLREADNDDLNKAAKARQKVVDAHELAIADQLEAVKADALARYANLAKIDRSRKVREALAAARNELATEESSTAEKELFRIEKEREGRGADDLVAQVDGSTPSLGRRFDDKLSEELARFKKYVLKMEDGAAPTAKQAAEIRTKMRELMQVHQLEPTPTLGQRGEGGATDAYRGGLGGLHFDREGPAGEAGEPVRLVQGATTDEQVALMRERGRATDRRAGGEPLMREVDPTGEGHLARAAAGAFKEEPFNGPRAAGREALHDPARPTPLSKEEDALVVKHDLAGDPINHSGPIRDREGPLYRSGQRLDEVILRLETAKGVGARELGRKARALDDFYDTLDLKNPDAQKAEKALRDRFRGGLVAAEKMSDVAAMINAQYAHFADRIAQVPGAGATGGGTIRPRAAAQTTAVVSAKPAPGDAHSARIKELRTAASAADKADAWNSKTIKDVALVAKLKKAYDQVHAPTARLIERMQAFDSPHAKELRERLHALEPLERGGTAVDDLVELAGDAQAYARYNLPRQIRPIVLDSSKDLKAAEETGSQWKGSKPKKPDAFVQQALAGGAATAKVLDRVATSTDAQAMGGALKTLLAHPEQNEHSARVVQALNERIGALAHDDANTALNLTRKDDGSAHDSKIHTNYVDFSLQRANSPTEVPAQLQAEVKDHITKVLGPAVDVQFQALLHAGDHTRGDKNGTPTDFIRLSLHSLDPMSTAFHESLHAFIARMREADLHGVNAALYKAANSFVMRGKLEKLLAGQGNALKQIRDGAPNATEERAAYMYQFYHTRDPVTGKRLLELNEAPRTVIEKIAAFVRNVLGIWSSDQRAVHIMDYLHSGEYARDGLGDRNAVQRVLLERGTNRTFEVVKKTLAPLTRIANNIISGGDAALADLQNPAIDTIRRLIYSHGTGQDKDPGWIVAHRTERTAVLNGLMNEFATRNTTAEDMQQAMQQLQSGVPARSAAARALAAEDGPIRQLLDRMHAYMTTAGVKVADLGVGDGYFPVVYDISHIASHEKEWRAMLDKYVRRGNLTPAAVDAITSKLLTNDGNLFGATDMPGMQHMKERKLDFLEPADRAPFVQKDLMTTLNSYVTQAARRAEWVRRFGDKNQVLEALKKDAVKRHGATKEDMAQLDRYIHGIDGTLGDDISPNLRRLFGHAIVYQNVRLLPMAVFSMAVDPMGIMVRGGTISDAFNAFKRGIMEIPRGFQKNPEADPMYDLSRTMGTIDDTALVHTLGTSYSQGMVGDTGRKINDVYFKYNLVEQMNVSMRVAALPAALRFIARHAQSFNERLAPEPSLAQQALATARGLRDQPLATLASLGMRSMTPDRATVHSERYLAELGLTRKDVRGLPDGSRPALTFQEFRDLGMNEDDAIAAALKMRNAVNKWVDGAVLRPNAAQKPVWSNDPHWALVAHLKQFVYAFHDTILKRVLTEAKYGNYTPAMALASYVPIMMAADFTKGLILGGGSQPDYKKGWDFGDYVGAGVQRAGLLSVGQFGIDALKDIRNGGSGLGPPLGPMLEQAGDALRVMGGREGVGSFITGAMPAAVIAESLAKTGVKADPNFSD